LKQWEVSFSSKVEQRLGKKLIALRLSDNKKKERVVVIGDIQVSEEEKSFLSLGCKFKVKGRDIRVDDMVYSIEEALMEINEEENRDRLRRKAMSLVKKEVHRRTTNLTKEERRCYERIKKRKDIVIERADKRGATVVMDKVWYDGMVTELVDGQYELVDKKKELLGFVAKM